uniref:Uncharacterized protein n=2 Tax=Rhizochromulina marina TaxID=1034831 RepID=A0A7S2WH76_9STRA
MADSGGSNWPLRGLKGTLWEGGMRVNALIRSSLVPASLRGSVYGNVFHASDWLPTIVQGILGRGDLLAKAENPLDGVNHWPALVKASSAVPRDRLVYNIDYDVSTGQVSGAIRIGDIKLIVNTVLENIFPVPKGDALQVQEAADDDASALDFMFNLTADPTESQDLRSSKPELFSHMLREFSQMQETMIADAFCGAADSAAANKVDAETQFIGPWIDDPYFKCPGEEKAGDALAHYNAILYLYNLVPRSKC